MSVLTYNNVTLPYCSTVVFDQQVMYDEIGHTDWYCTKFDIHVNSIININYLATLFSDLVLFPATAGGAFFSTVTSSPADIIRVLRVKLMQPRMKLSFKFNGRELIPAPLFLTPNPGSLPGTVDSQNGPRPVTCNITQFNNETFLVSYHIVAHYWENPNPDQPLPVVNRIGVNNSSVLYNRWTETVEIDKTNLTKRVREGTYAIRSDNWQGLLADNFRDSFAVLGVPAGFTRESASYVQAPDGLSIKYIIIDKEVFRYPPFPAYEATGYYQEVVGKAGAVRTGEAVVKLKGAKVTPPSQGGIGGGPQATIVEVAAAVCTNKLFIGGGFGDFVPGVRLRRSFVGIIEYASITVDLYDNVVECRMKAQMTRTRQTLGGAGGIDLVGLTFTPGSDGAQAVQPTYQAYGTAGYVLRAAAYFDPSLARVLNPATGQMTGGLVPGQAANQQENVSR